MAVTFESVEVTPLSQALARVVAKATFSEQTDVSDWTLFGVGDVQFQATGPVDAATLNLQRSTVDPSGTPNTTQVATATGNASTVGVTASYQNAAPAWFRLANAATFGPANAVTARTLASLAAAINGWAYDYWGFAAHTDSVPTVNATYDATTLTVTAITPGVAGNSIAVAETLTNGSWAGGGVFLANGADAVAADGTLTFAELPTDTLTVTIGDVTYTFVAALAVDDYEVLIGGDIEATRDNLLDAINGTGDVATGVLTAADNPADGDTVTIISKIYTFKTALTSADAPYEVLIGAAATDSLDNLIAAVNSGAGAGTTYGYNTPPNADVSAAAGAGDTIDFSSRYSGVDANNITTVADGADLSWGAATLTGATGAGVTYSESVEAHPLVDAAALSTNGITATALTAGTAGNSIATTDTLGDVHATGTLTFTPGTVTTQTIQIGGVYYIYAADPTSDPAADGSSGNPWQVDVGVDDTTSLANLASAINADGTAGVTYSTALTANPLAESTASDATTVDVQAILPGGAGNSISTTVPAGAGFAWGAITLTGGGGEWDATTLLGGAAAVAASLVLTMGGAFNNNGTVTVGAVIYTLKTTLTPTDGEVMIAGTLLNTEIIGTREANV